MPEIKFTLTGDASDLAAGLQSAQTYTGQIAKDFEAISTAMDMVLSRAQKMTDFYQNNVALLEQMKQILTLIGAMDQANQSAMNSNLQAARELSSQVLRQGGTFGDVNNMLRYAGGGGGAGNMVQNMSSMFQQVSNNTAANSATHEANNADTSILKEAMAAARASSSRSYDSSAVKGAVPEDYFGTPTGAALPPTVIPPGGLSMPALNAKNNLLNFKNIFGGDPNRINEERLEYASLDAYDRGTRQIDKLLGTRGFGGGVGSLLKKGMYGDRRKVQDAIEVMRRRQETDPDIFSRIYSGKDEFDQPFAKNSEEARLHSVLTRLDKNLGMANSPIGQAIGKGAGYLGTAASVYQLASQIASAGRVATGYVQTQGQGYGTVQYGTSAGNALEAGLRSFGGLNPYYSFGNAQQAQNAGISLGYRGSDLRKYEDVAQHMQTSFGMTQSQTAQAVGTLQQVGMTPAQTAAMLASVRGEAGSVRSGYFNTSAATQASVTAAAGFSSWGGTKVGGGRAGSMSSRFIGSDAILAGKGLTGQEGLNSMFGLAMMANAEGISIDQAYSQRAKMSSTAAGTSKYIDMYSKTILQQLSNAVGMDLTRAKNKEEVSKHGVELMYGLQGLQVPVQDPQTAVEYTWQLIQQAKGKFDKAKPDPNRSGYYNGKPISATNHASRGGSYSNTTPAGDAASNPKPSSSDQHPSRPDRSGAAIDPSRPSTPTTYGPPLPSSPHNLDDYATQAYNKYSQNKNGQGASGGSGDSSGSTNINILLDFKNPHLKNIIGASVKQQTDSTNGTSAPSSRPSRATS